MVESSEGHVSDRCLRGCAVGSCSSELGEQMADSPIGPARYAPMPHEAPGTRSHCEFFSSTSRVEQVGEYVAHLTQYLRADIADRFRQPLVGDCADVLALRRRDHLETVARVRLDAHLRSVATECRGQRPRRSSSVTPRLPSHGRR